MVTEESADRLDLIKQVSDEDGQNSSISVPEFQRRSRILGVTHSILAILHSIFTLASLIAVPIWFRDLGNQQTYTDFARYNDLLGKAQPQFINRGIIELAWMVPLGFFILAVYYVILAAMWFFGIGSHFFHDQIRNRMWWAKWIVYGLAMVPVVWLVAAFAGINSVMQIVQLIIINIVWYLLAFAIEALVANYNRNSSAMLEVGSSMQETTQLGISMNSHVRVSLSYRTSMRAWMFSVQLLLGILMVLVIGVYWGQFLTLGANDGTRQPWLTIFTYLFWVLYGIGFVLIFGLGAFRVGALKSGYGSAMLETFYFNAFMVIFLWVVLGGLTSHVGRFI